MLMRVTTRLLLIAIVLGVSACASAPRGNSPTALPSYQGSGETFSLGAVIDLPANEESSLEGKARVLDEYFSASGRRCARVELQTVSKAQRIMCERDDGQWSLTRSLFDSEHPGASRDLIIKTPLSSYESAPVALVPEPVNDELQATQPVVLNSIGLDFDVRYAHLSSFDGRRAWNFAGTSTAGPESWATTPLATLANVSVNASGLESQQLDEPITGRR